MPQYVLTATRGTATITEVINAVSQHEALRQCIGPLMRLAFDPKQPERATGEVTLRDEAGYIVYHDIEEM